MLKRVLAIFLGVYIIVFFIGCKDISDSGLLGEQLHDLYNDVSDFTSDVQDDIVQTVTDSFESTTASTSNSYTYDNTSKFLDVNTTNSTAGQKPILNIVQKTFNMNVGDINTTTFTLQDDSKNLKFTISSLNEAIAIASLSDINTISIAAVGEGATTIVVTVVDEDSQTVSQDISVVAIKSDSNSTLPNVSINSGDLVLVIGQTANVNISATSDNGIASLDVIPSSSNIFATISQTPTTVSSNQKDVNVSITAVSIGNFDIIANAYDNNGHLGSNSIKVTIQSNDINNTTTNSTNAIYDPQACLLSNGYVAISDNSFDPEGNYDQQSGIAIKSLYPMTFNPNDSLVTMYYFKKDHNSTNWNVYYDDTYKTYYISYTDDWLNDINNTVYIKTPDQKCWRLKLDSASISSGTPELVTNQ